MTTRPDGDDATAKTHVQPKPVQAPVPETGIDEELLALVADLSFELHPHRLGRWQPSLSQELDADFGLDSLGRAELMARLEAAFNVRLPDSLLAEARTPEDLVRAINEASPESAKRPIRAPKSAPAGEVRQTPLQISTMTAVLDWHTEHNGGRPHVYLSDGEREGPPITYRQMSEQSRHMARNLSARGVLPGQTVAIMLPTSADFFYVFFAILYAGAVPVPIYPPLQLAKIEEHLRRQAKILANAGAVMLVSVPEAGRAATALKALVPGIGQIVTAQELTRTGQDDGTPFATPQPSDIALLQYTSGSTGDPKGVILSHANILANIRAMGDAMQASEKDILVSWLPLYHDMGLIGTWLTGLYYAVPVVIMSPLNFLARPERWLWTIDRARATISVGPNFAYEQCVSKLSDDSLKGLDLSSLRLLVDGSEPVLPRTVRDFNRRFAPYGLRETALQAGYGLAESAVGLALPSPDKPAQIDRIKKDVFLARGRAVPVSGTQRDVLEFVSCGPPLIGHELRVVDETGHEVEERQEGRLQFRGPSATRGYYRNESKTKALFDGTWLETGDLAYIAGGEAYLTGRTKDIIFRAGRNIHPTEVEQAVGALPQIAPGGVVLFGAGDPQRGTERLVLMIETPLPEGPERAALVNRTEQLARDLLGLPPDDVIPVPPRTIPRTASGKIRRQAAQQNYVAGRPLGRRRAVWWQLARLRISALLGTMRRAGRAGADRAYATYWWAVVWLFLLVLSPFVLFLPRLSWRWAVVQAAVRPLFWMLGHRLTIEKESEPPRKNVMFVANHASYLDHAALLAVLRGSLSFAAYEGLATHALQGLAAKRLGTLFVERFEAAGGLKDTDKALALARRGRALVFYPEATASRMPGLLDFRMGAFVVAAKAGIPVVPITIRGTRSILRHDLKWFPRRGSITVHVGTPIYPQGEEFKDALAIKEAARNQILAHCGEPDIAGERPRF